MNNRPSDIRLFQRRGAFAALGLVALMLLAACGGGTDKSKAQLRLVNASTGYAELSLRLDDVQRQGQVAYGETGVYAEVDPGTVALSVAAQSSSTALLNFSTSLSKSRYTTVLAYGAAGALRQAVLDDNQDDPDANKALLRVFNAAPDAGGLDVYLTGTDEPLSASVPQESAAAVGSTGAWRTLSSGSWRLRVTASGSKTDIRLDLSGISLSSKQITTLVLTPGSGGVLVNALFLGQRSAVTARANTQARVRVATGVIGGGNVSAIVGGVTLLNSSPSPAVGAYGLVAAGSQSTALTVGTRTVSMAAFTLTPGADYSLLVLGSSNATAVTAGAAPLQGSWVVDNNRQLSNSTQVRVRLVNGLADLSDPLSMTVASFPLAGEAAVGAASATSELDSNSKALLAVTARNAASPLFSAVDQVLEAGGSYSLFMLGSAAAPAGVLRRDR